jgi:hypothetical protein
MNVARVEYGTKRARGVSVMNVDLAGRRARPNGGALLAVIATGKVSEDTNWTRRQHTLEYKQLQP